MENISRTFYKKIFERKGQVLSDNIGVTLIDN